MLPEPAWLEADNSAECRAYNAQVVEADQRRWRRQADMLDGSADGLRSARTRLPAARRTCGGRQRPGMRRVARASAPPGESDEPEPAEHGRRSRNLLDVHPARLAAVPR
jgi:hypothetical protein